ncbi:MAG: DUF805 domain-containing protein [Clostridia bacterium]|nr:DUF805 domain-containing protein [Clostridia bacterium]
MNWYIQSIKNYCNFSGRARRTEYWMFALVNMVISFVLGAIDAIIGIPVFSTLYELFILVPALALSARRLHDINKSGWFILINLIPLVGAIITLVFAVTPGTVGANNYGDDPKGSFVG